MKYAFSLILWVTCLSNAYSEQVFEHSGQPPQLIELFTSEGCSSCPPADQWLSQLNSQEGLWEEFVPLAFHVDYWDWLGWKDRFANEAYSQRQRDYKKFGRLGSVYTPGFVVAGNEWKGFFTHRQLPKNRLAKADALRLSVNDSKFTLSYSGNKNSVGRAYVAVLGMGLETKVKRGENAGEVLTHDFVVLDLVVLEGGKTLWNGDYLLEEFSGESLAVAAWVEHVETGLPEQVVGGLLN